jgi:Holliday junction DNA helicase RuvA
MITHIKGRLTEKTPTYVVIDCNGIGYKLNISLQTYSNIKEENCSLFTHLSVKEDSHTLYGFSDEDERTLFRNLISVSGVGPSTAQVVLSTFTPKETCQYIISADVAALQSVKGIGGKTAQRIIIDLKDKLGKGITTTDIPLYQNNDLRSEALSALVALGFSKKVAEQKVDNTLRESSEDISVEALVKSALSGM